MKPIVYIDGQDGTTGLQIFQRLGARDDISLLHIDPTLRKDPQERKRLMAQADVVFLCLPDAAAMDAVSMMAGTNTRIIDASSAHRTNPDWVYGFCELNPSQREKIAKAQYVANPGCHATGFVSIVAPLVSMGILSSDTLLSCHSLTGYSGGGKGMIADYESDTKASALQSPCLYALGQGHKHLPEMATIAGLSTPPVFTPIVDDYYKGMATTVPLHRTQLNGISSVDALREALSGYYANQPLVSVLSKEETAETGKIFANTNAGSDHLSLLVCGNDTHITITALFDNLGKGASGAAVQNMNLMLGFAETTGLA